MNVAATAESRCVAIPQRRCVRGTNIRGIPKGVGSGVASTNSDVVGSTVIRDLDMFSVSGSAGVAMAIAVDIR